MKKALWMLALLGGLCGRGRAAVTINNLATVSFTSQNTAFTWSVSTGVGSNILGVVVVGQAQQANPQTFDTVTWGGSGFTRVTVTGRGGNPSSYVECWILNGLAASTTQNLVVHPVGFNSINEMATWIPLNGVDPFVPTGGLGGIAGTASGAHTVSITTLFNNSFLLDAMASTGSSGAPTITFDASLTQDVNLQAGATNNRYGVAHKTTGTAGSGAVSNTTTGGTMNSYGDFLLEVVPVQPTATPTSTPTASPTPTFTASPTPTFTASPTPTFTASPTPTFTASPTPTFTITSTFTNTPTATATATPTPTPTFTRTETPACSTLGITYTATTDYPITWKVLLKQVSVTAGAEYFGANVYITAAQGKLAIGLYDYGVSPTVMVAHSALFTATTGWNFIPFTTGALNHINYYLAAMGTAPVRVGSLTTGPDYYVPNHVPHWPYSISPVPAQASFYINGVFCKP